MNSIRTMPRPIYVIYRFLYDLLAVGSRLLNATVFGGSTHQTTSARAYIESTSDPVWAKRRIFINRLFPWQADHCKEQWEYDVEQALKVLERNDALRLQQSEDPAHSEAKEMLRSLV